MFEGSALIQAKGGTYLERSVTDRCAIGIRVSRVTASMESSSQYGTLERRRICVVADKVEVAGGLLGTRRSRRDEATDQV